MYRARPCKICGTVFQPRASRQVCCGQVCRFWSHVDKSAGENGCWPWQSNIISRSGYGNFCDDARRFITTHRFSFELAHGPIPEGLDILHSCDHRPCVNPKHLSAGTAKDNVADMWSKGRQQRYDNHSRGDSHYSRKDPTKLARGETHGLTKLTEPEVLLIIAAHGKETPTALAKRFGVGKWVIRSILSGKTWRHVPRLPSYPV